MANRRAGQWQGVVARLQDLRLDQRKADAYIAPILDVVRFATSVAARLKKQGIPAPSSIVLDGNRGFVFEWKGADITVRIEINDNKHITQVVFACGKVMSRCGLEDDWGLSGE